MKGTIRKRKKKNGTIVWDVIVPLGKDPKTGKYKQKWVTVQGTEGDAEIKLAELTLQLAKGINIQPEKVTVSELMKMWLDDRRVAGLAYKTLVGYESIIQNHIKPNLGHIHLTKLHPAQLKELYNKLLSEGRRENTKTLPKSLSPTTVLHVHRVIHAALRYAVKWELVHRNVADVVTPPKQAEREMWVLPKEKVSALLDGLKGTYLYMPTYIAVGTGMRLGEILAIRWQDVDLKQDIISVKQI